MTSTANDAAGIVAEINGILRRRSFDQLDDFEFRQVEALLKQMHERFDILPPRKFREEMGRRARLLMAH